MIEFDWYKWNVNIIQKPEELNKKIKELNIFNKQITEINTPSFIYNFEFGIQEKEQQDCLVEIDRPLIIIFEDNSQLEIDFSEASSLKLGYNSLLNNIDYSKCQIELNKYFSECIGNQIIDFNILTTKEYDDLDFTGSYGIEDPYGQELFIKQLKLILQNNLAIVFEPYYDYGQVYLEDTNGVVKKITYNKIRESLK